LHEELGRYRLIELIGEGGMGKVYRAHDTKMRRDVALKVLPPQLAAVAGFRERFAREAYAAARLAEPHIIPIHEADEIDGHLYLVMPVIDGTDAQALLNRDGLLSPQLSVKIVEQLAAALDAAHADGLVHRDVKPSNALITADDFVYLIDFGLVQDGTAKKLTPTGSNVGTWCYMAPERFSDGSGDARADVYALACVLYEFLTGELPFPGNTQEQQCAGHLTRDVPKPTTINPAVPVGFDDVIARGMAKDPDQRYQTAGELATAARQALGDDAPQASSEPESKVPPAPVGVGRPPLSRASSVRPRRVRRRAKEGRRRWRRIIGVAAVVVIVAASVWVSAFARRRTSQPVPDVQSPQVTLPFTGLSAPTPVAVDLAGGLYVGDFYDNRLLKLASGSFNQTTLPFTGLNHPQGVAVDRADTVYATGSYPREVLKLAAGETTPIRLPFKDIQLPAGIAVDAAGSVYLTDPYNGWVVKLPAGASEQTLLPFTGLNFPEGVAVDTEGAVYVCDTYNDRVLKLPAGASAQTVLPFSGLKNPEAVAVDRAGAVYVSDSATNRVLKLPARARSQTVLPFSGLDHPEGVAVDGAGNVYVADSGHNRVLKLPVQ
jgi:serine/threonine-protein kinase